MVLDDVADCPGLVVIAGALSNAFVLRDRDLDGLDKVAIPDRLEQRVREPEGEDVLDRFLGEVMIDPKGLLPFGGFRGLRIQFAGGPPGGAWGKAPRPRPVRGRGGRGGGGGVGAERGPGGRLGVLAGGGVNPDPRGCGVWRGSASPRG